MLWPAVSLRLCPPAPVAHQWRHHSLSLSLSLFLSLPQLWMNHVECRMSCRDLIRGYRTCHSEMSTACRTVWPAPAECARSPASDVMHSKWKRDLERERERESETSTAGGMPQTTTKTTRQTNVDLLVEIC